MKSGKSKKTVKTEQHDKVPQHKKDFDQFHQENGVRTIQGDIGPVRSGEFAIFCIVADVRYTHQSSIESAHAPEERLSTCIHIKEICFTTRIHPS